MMHSGICSGDKVHEEGYEEVNEEAIMAIKLVYLMRWNPSQTLHSAVSDT